MDLSQVTPTNKNLTLLLEIVTLLRNYLTKSEGILEVEIIGSKHNSNSAQPLTSPKKWMVDVTKNQF